MLVYHPVLSPPPNEVACGESNYSKLKFEILLDMFAASLFILPRPYNNNTIQLLPTKNNPIWRPSSFVLSKMGVAEKTLRLLASDQKLAIPALASDLQKARQIPISVWAVHYSRSDRMFRLALREMDYQFDRTFAREPANLKAERFFNACLKDNLDWFADNVPTHTTGEYPKLKSVFENIAADMLSRHATLIGLPATMPFEHMKSIV